MKNKKSFERALPSGYRQVLHIDAKSIKLGIVLNLVALGVMLAIVGLGALVSWQLQPAHALSDDSILLPLSYLLFALSFFVYLVLHELLHGFFYKLQTHERLTFGLSWSCAFCGVPKVYTYRKTAMLSAAAPLVLFTLVLIPLCGALLFVHPRLYYLSLALLGIHLGGCSGDIYLVGLLLFRYRTPEALVRDTGPEQFIYIPDRSDKNI